MNIPRMMFRNVPCKSVVTNVKTKEEAPEKNSSLINTLNRPGQRSMSMPRGNKSEQSTRSP